MTAAPSQAPPTAPPRREIDPATREALARLKPRLEARYGARLRGLILFGSRARGDHRPYSDADLAVILEGPIERPFAIKGEILDDSYDIFLDTGVDIEPWPIEEGGVRNPEAHPTPISSGRFCGTGLPCNGQSGASAGQGAREPRFGPG